MGSREQRKKPSSLQGRLGLFRNQYSERKSSAPELLGKPSTDSPVIMPREFKQGEVLFTFNATSTIKIHPYPPIYKDEPFSICYHKDTDTNRLFIQVGELTPQFMPRSVILSALNKNDLRFDYLECVDALASHPSLINMLYYEDKLKTRFDMKDTVSLFIARNKIPALFAQCILEEDGIIQGDKNTLFRVMTPLVQALVYLLSPEHNANMKTFVNAFTDFLVARIKNVGGTKKLKDIAWLTKQSVEYLAALQHDLLPKELLYVMTKLTPHIRKNHSEEETTKLLGVLVMLRFIVPAVAYHDDLKGFIQLCRALQVVANHKIPFDDDALFGISNDLQLLFPDIEKFFQTLASSKSDNMPFDAPPTADTAIKLYNCLVLNQLRLQEQSPARGAIEDIITRVAKLEAVKHLLEINVINQPESQPRRKMV